MRRIVKIKSVKIWYQLNVWCVQLLCSLRFCHVATAASVGHSLAWRYSSATAVWSTCSSYLVWNRATAYMKKGTNLGYFLWASGLQLMLLPSLAHWLILHNSPKHCQSCEYISPAVAVRISCRYGTVNGMILSRNLLFYTVPPFY